MRSYIGMYQSVNYLDDSELTATKTDKLEKSSKSRSKSTNATLINGTATQQKASKGNVLNVNGVISPKCYD